MKYCYMCGKDLSETKENEHIIPNALGGKLKSREILCDVCNGIYSDIDRKLCSDLDVLTNLIAPHKDYNSNQYPHIITECNGEKFERFADGSYRKYDCIKYDGKNLIFNFNHSINSFAEQKDLLILKNQIKKIGKKHNKDSLWVKEFTENILKKASKERNETQQSQTFTFTPNKSGYSNLGVLKIALDFCYYHNIEKEHIESSIDILRNKSIEDCKKITAFFNDSSVFLTKSVYHTLYLRGDKTTNLLYVIVSLYGVYNILVMLSTTYNGNNIEGTYCYDIYRNKKINYSISYIITKQTYKKLLASKADIKTFKINLARFKSYAEAKDIIRCLGKNIDEIPLSTFLEICALNKRLNEGDYKEYYIKLFCDKLKLFKYLDFLCDRGASIALQYLEKLYTFDLYDYRKDILIMIHKFTYVLYSSAPKTKEEFISLLTDYIYNYKFNTDKKNKIHMKERDDLINFFIQNCV